MKTITRSGLPAMRITIEVDELTGNAFKKASPQVQRSIQERAGLAIRHAFMDSEEVGAEFDRIRSAAVPFAREQGWNAELNDRLLRGEYDYD